MLVVNHHLLFSDLAVRRAQGNWTAPAVLPPYRRVVLDEAHNLEDAATSHLGVNVSKRGLMRLLGRVDRRGKGVLRGVEERLKLLDQPDLRRESLGRIERDVRPDVGNARQRGAELFRDRVTDHLLRHMRSLRQDRVRVVGHPDSPEGSVEVDGGGAPVQVGRFRVAPSTPDDGAQVQAGVPAWVWVVAVLVLAVLLF